MTPARLMTPLLPVLLLTACSDSQIVGATGDVDTADDTTVDGGDTGDTGDTGEDLSMWDDARLVVLSPESGAFLPLGEDVLFEAVIYSADGDALDFEDITWESSIDSGWSPTGDLFEDDSLDVGTHAITAQAVLPNGDRLAHTMGGLLVQHEDAGIYVGDVRVDVTLSWDGADYTLGCIGATTVTVDAYGESAVGDSDCVLSLAGYDLETSYDFDLIADEGDLEGMAQVNLVLFNYELDMSGAVGDGELTGDFSASEFAQIDGELNTTRVSRDVSGSR